MHICPHCGQEIRVDRMLEHVLKEHPDKQWSESLPLFAELNKGIKVSAKQPHHSRSTPSSVSNKKQENATRQRRKYSKSRCQICGDDLVNFYFAKKAGDDQRPSAGSICQTCYSFLKREGKSSGYLRYSYASASKSVYTVNSGQTRKDYRY
jgi:hypothetical protein